ncbi:hypothetical protein E6C76_02855 [Pseudothauera nasutitermitis]|uniref:Lipoprotein n=1 Tax=Pseudothauera nasutitermitis TaxID=2565930 RepID=A0A4S4B4W8_9RHOO|nr:hypothetical protein [Pseudothauera nasutitermitis]THF67331.1 hypothetical protein E6C76_02855 [Pseudothauera nasutitermitis]
MKGTLLLALATAGLLTHSSAWSAPAQDSIARGLMILHGERLIFSPCRERSYVQVEDESPGGETVAALRALGLAQDIPLYVELFGSAEGGALRMRGLNFAHTEARCPAPRHATGAWQAAGDSPAWRMNLVGEVMHLERAEQPALRTPIRVETAAAVHLRATDGSARQWTLEKKTCLKREQGFASGWSATGHIDGETLSGCAWKP